MDGKAGDYLIENDKAAVTITHEGRIADFGLKGTRDELVWLNPNVSIGLNALDTPIQNITISPNQNAIFVGRTVLGKQLLLSSWVYLVKDQLHVETIAENTGDDPALAVTLGERVSWGNVPTWMDGRGFIKTPEKIVGGFLGRDALGVAYAMCSEEGPLFAKFDEQEYGGFFEPARTGESVVLAPARGRSPSRKIVMTTSTVSLGHAVMALPCPSSLAAPARAPLAAQANTSAMERLEVRAVPVPRAQLEVVRCDDGGKPGKPFVMFRGAERAERAEAGGTTFSPISLPKGCFKARFVAPGHKEGVFFDPIKLKEALPEGAVPLAGKLAFSISENGSPTPARLVIRGINGTSDPNFGDDAEGTGAAANVLATEAGTGSVALPPGKYQVLITRGFEYSAKEEKIEVKPQKTASINVALERVVSTKGWVAADLHLHAVPSSDAPSLLTDRVRSLVAAGIEIAVATDHNAITDYGPAIKELQQERHIRNVVGNEITTRDTPFGHFNAFPLDPTAPPTTYKGVTPRSLFAEVRTSKPYGKDTLLQVNHPRMGGIGYFELLRFDPVDIPAWLARSPLADLGFDALEVFNGDHYTRISKVEECLKDWFALLNAGYRSTATGNSDSHRVSFHEPGVPRTLVRLAEDDLSKFDERAFVEAIRKGRATVSSGPFITMRAGSAEIGDSVEPGDVEFEVHVDGPAWVDMTEVWLIKRGEMLKSWNVEKQSGKRPWTFRHKDTLKKGDWVIALARGKKPMTYLYRSGAIPFGFTNPIFTR